MTAAGPLILVVDDVELMRDLLGLQLGRAGCRVDNAEDGAAALAALHARRYDLVLMDRAMPNLDGCEATRAWRAHEQAHGLAVTPIVGVGGQPDDRLDCLAAGMQDFMVKPLTIAAVDVLLKRFLAPRNLTVTAAQAGPHTTQAARNKKRTLKCVS